MLSVKKFFKEKLKDFLKYERFLKFKKVKIKNDDVTILCNCCIGGLMYHDVNHRFLSPTVNLFFSHHCFIDFVNNLEQYGDAELVDTGKFDEGDGGRPAPIGVLKKDGLPDIELHFLHYKTFEQAKQKWQERYSRINRDKIFLVIEAQAEHEYQLIDEYAQLPYPKIIFTDLPSDKSKSVMHMKVYDQKKGITQFVGLSGKRGYDEYDFVNEIFNRRDFKE